MTTSPASQVIMTDKDYRQIALDMFQGYAEQELEGKVLWESIKMDFKRWTKEQWDAAINGNTWSMITKYCIPRGVWIDSYEDDSSQSEILMKLVSAPRYDVYLKDWDMDRINLVAQCYGKVSRVVAHRLRHLRGEEPEEIQQFQDTGYQPTRIFNPAPPTSKMTAMDVSRLNIRNKRNDYQQAPTPISNQVPNSFTSEIRKDCESIPECLTAPAPAPAPPVEVSPIQAPRPQVSPTLASPIQAPLPSDKLGRINKTSQSAPLTPAPLIEAPPAPPILAAPVQELPVQVPSVLAASVSAPLTQVLPAEQETPAKEAITPDKDVTSEKVPSDARVFNSSSVDDLTYVQSNSDLNRDSYIWPPTKQTSLLDTSSDCVEVIKSLPYDVPETSTNCSIIFHPHYKEIPGITECAYNPLLLQPPPQLLSLPGDWSKCVVKFGTYHPHYKEKREMTEFAYNLSLIQPSSEQISLPGALFDCVIKPANHHPHYKEKLGMTKSAYKPSLLRPPPQLSSPPNDRPDYVGQFAAYHPHYKEKSGMTKSAHNPLLVRPLPKLLSLVHGASSNCCGWTNRPDASFNLSCAAQTAKFLPDSNDLLSQIDYVICLTNTTIKANIDWYSIKYKRVTRIVLAAELYHNLADSVTKAQISSTLKSQHYGMVRTGEHGTVEHGTGKYGTGEYKYLSVLERVASVATLVAGKYDVGILMLRM